MRIAGSTCGAGSMQLSRVRPSVRLSVCLSHSAAAAGDLLLWARRPATRYRSILLHGRRVDSSRDGAQQQTQSGDVGSWTWETCYVALTS